MKENTQKRDSKISIAVATIIVAFFVFYFLKVNGNFDFTHNYGIKDIDASIDHENVMLMIDGDAATTWNAPTFLGETLAVAGDSVTITLDKKREVSGIKVTGILPEDLVIITDAGETQFDMDTSGDLSFKEMIETETIRLILPEDGNKARWQITELEVY